jgi:hypothetical protein
MKRKRISAEEIDRLFDEGKEDVLQYFDMSKARRPNLEFKRVMVDFPAWMIHGLDDEAARLGVTRQSVIKTWIAEKIDERRRRKAAAPAAARRQRQVAERPQARYRAKKTKR